MGEDRVALEDFKKEKPEEYAQMIEQQEIEKKQQAEFKRQERLKAAALARKKAKEAGEDEEESTPKPQKQKSSKSKKKGSWMSTIVALLVLAGIGYAIYFFATGGGTGGSKPS